MVSINSFRRSIRRRRNTVTTLIALTLLGVAVEPAHAIDVTSPITGEDGTIACPTCSTAASVLPQYGIPYSTSGTRALSAVTVNGTATKKYLQQVSGGAPTLEQPVLSDLTAFTSADFAGKISDETGTGVVVLGSSPTITSPTISTSIDLPASAVNAITEIDSSIKIGSGTKLATYTGALPGANRCVRVNATNDLEATSADCVSSSGVYAVLTPKSQTKVSSGSTTVYMDAVGSVGTADDLGTQTVVPAGTWANLRCSASSNGTAASVTAAKGTCGSALTVTSTTVALATANDVTSDTTNTFTTTAGQCINFKIAKTSFVATAWVTCVLERTV